MGRGLLVVVEGINGAGKSTIIEKLIERYQTTSISLSVYKFPNRNGKYGQSIDRYLKGIDRIKSKYDVLNMFALDRESVRGRIESDLSNGFLVICDRYVYSAIAYHIPPNVVQPYIVYSYCGVIGHFDRNMPIPDITYIIDGNHLVKRGVVGREIFHYIGKKATRLTNMLKLVANCHNTAAIVIKNEDGKINNLIEAISRDIEFRWNSNIG
jgi:dTMP kinase